MDKTKTVIIEGPMLREGEDPDGDIFHLDKVAFEEFINKGHVACVCTTSPAPSEIVGEPVDATREGDNLLLKSKVFNPEMVTALEAAEEGSKKRDDDELRFGYAIAGVIEKYECAYDKVDPFGIDQVKDMCPKRNILKCRITSVALVPRDKLTDKNCVVKIVDE